MNKKKIIQNIINDYKKFQEEMSNNTFDNDIENDLYDTWLKKLTEEIFDDIKEDLVDLCEDNEEMESAIRTYFGEDNENDM